MTDTPVPCGGDPDHLWILSPAGLSGLASRAREEGSPQPRSLLGCRRVKPSLLPGASRSLGREEGAHPRRGRWRVEPVTLVNQIKPELVLKRVS